MDSHDLVIKEPSKIKCSVPECDDKYSSRFRFPKDAEKMKQWLMKVRNPLLNSLSFENVYNKYRVCSRHFLQEFIVGDPTARRGITWNAVPLLYLPERKFINLM